jgi:hypothetical protein
MWQRIIWNEERGGNVEHVEEHGLTIDDVEHVLTNLEARGLAGRQVCPAFSVTRLMVPTLLWSTRRLMQIRSIR